MALGHFEEDALSLETLSKEILSSRTLAPVQITELTATVSDAQDRFYVQRFLGMLDVAGVAQQYMGMVPWSAVAWGLCNLAGVVADRPGALGGAFGRGIGEGRVKWDLPDAHTDFIFAVARDGRWQFADRRVDSRPRHRRG